VHAATVNFRRDPGCTPITLRNVLAIRRRALLDRLATDESGVIEPAFVSLLADTHTAIAAVDAELIEMEGGVQ
jgi:hypothetical protein